jgi:hypothetical protein
MGRAWPRIPARKQTGDAVRQRPDVQRHHHGRRPLARRQGGDDGPQAWRSTPKARSPPPQVTMFGNGQSASNMAEKWAGSRARRRVGAAHALERRRRAGAAVPQAAAKHCSKCWKPRGATSAMSAHDRGNAGRARPGLTRRPARLGEVNPLVPSGQSIQRRADQRLAQVAVMVAGAPARPVNS